MSAPLATEVLRELGAETRCFTSLAQLMIWWRLQRLRRDARALGVERGSGPQSQERIDQTNATFARVTRCMCERDPEFDLEDWPLSGWRIDALADWIVSSVERGRVHLADRLGWSIEVCDRFMGETASVLARRMRGRGLIR